MSREIVAAVGDMIFASKISGSAEHVGVNVSFTRTLDNLLELARARPSLIILDLNNPRFDTIEALSRLKADAQLRDIPVVGFLSHVQVDLWKQAEARGCDRVLPRSKFTEKLADILTGSY